MRLRVAAVLVGLALAGCEETTPLPAPAGPAIEDAWVRLPAVPGRPAAAYFTLVGGPKAERVTGAESSGAQSAELHEGGMVNGVMTMHRLDSVALPAGGSVAFRPGGNHVMLYGLAPSVRAGGTLPLTLRLESGGALSADAKVVAAGDAPAHDGGH